MKLNIFCCFFSSPTTVENFDGVGREDSDNNYNRASYIHIQEMRKNSIDNLIRSKKLNKLYSSEDRDKIIAEGSAVKYLQDESVADNNLNVLSP